MKRKSGKAKKMVMQPQYQMKVQEDKTKKKFSRKTKHKNHGKDHDSFYFMRFCVASCAI